MFIEILKDYKHREIIVKLHILFLNIQELITAKGFLTGLERLLISKHSFSTGRFLVTHS